MRVGRGRGGGVYQLDQNPTYFCGLSRAHTHTQYPLISQMEIIFFARFAFYITGNKMLSLPEVAVWGTERSKCMQKGRGGGQK